jgi:hypothetical protein
VVYWGARITIQLTLFQKYKPQGRHFWIGELALSSLFIYLVIIYGLTAFHAMGAG